MLGVPDAYELPPVPGLGYLKPDPTSLVRFKAAYVSGPPTGRVRVRRDEGGKLQGILPFTISEVLKLDVEVPEAEPEPQPAEPGEQDSLLDIAVGHMVGKGPAAHQVWLPPLDVPDTLDQLMPDLAVDPRLGLVSQEWRRLGALTVPLGTVDRPREQRRDTLSVDLSGSAGHVAVVGGPAQRQEHPAALDRHEHGADVDAAGDAVLRPRLRWRDLLAARSAAARLRCRDPLRARRGHPDRRRGAGHRGPARGLLPPDGHRLDRDLPAAPRAGRGPGPGRRRLRRRVPGDRRLGHAALGLRRHRDRPPAAVHPRPHLRPAHRRGGLAVVGLPGRDAGHVRHPARAAAGRPRRLRDRPAGRRPGARRPARSRPGRQQAALPRRAAPHRRGHRGRRPRRRRRRPGRQGAVGVDGARPARSSGCCRRGSTSTTSASRPVLPSDRLVARHRREGPRPRSPSTPCRSRTCWCSATAARARAPCCARWPRRSCAPARRRRPRSCWSTTAARTSARCPRTTSSTTSPPPPRRRRRCARSRPTSRAGSPGPTSRPSSCASGPGGPAPSCSSWSTTTTWSPPSRARRSPPLQPLLAQARDVGLHLAVARRSGGASRALYEPVIQSLRDLAMPGLMLSGNPEEGPLLGNQRPILSPPGRGRLVTRDRGVEVVQLAWAESRRA